MAKYRTTQMGYWNDPYIERLSKDGKLLYIYMITSPHTNNLGVLEVTLKRISFETDIDVDTVDRLLAQMESDGKVVRDREIIWVVNFIKHQCTVSSQLLKGLIAEVQEITSVKILAAMARRYPQLNIPPQTVFSEHDTLSKPYQYPMDTPAIPSEEQEQELEQEQEQEQELEQEGEHKKINTCPQPAPVTAADAARTSPPECPHEAIVGLYHEILPALPRVKVWTDARRSMLRTRWREDRARQNLDWWRHYFELVADSDFLCGRCPPDKNGRTFMADLEWLIKPTNMPKVLEGKYSNRKSADVFERAKRMGYDEIKRQAFGSFGSLRDEIIDIDGEVQET